MLDEKKKIKIEGQKQLAAMKADLIKQEFQDNLKGHLEKRLQELTDKLKDRGGSKLSIIQLKSLISEKNIIGSSPKYTVTELEILFDYYKQFIERINQEQTYLPTLKNFCSFAGISSTQYNNWRQSDESERREIMQKIDDYITDIMLTSAQTGEVREITTMFKAKTEHGYVEAQAPIVFEHKSTANMNEIMKQIEAVKQGKSLKAIELKEQKDGSFAPEEE